MISVAVSQRVDTFPDRNEVRDGLDQRLVAFVASCGLVPLPVPNSLGAEIHDWLTVVRPSGVILSGGNDISTLPQRDETEVALLNYAYNLQIPVLGICRGMQMLAHWSGVELHPVLGHAGTKHFLSGEIIGEVNSYHRFALETCPLDFEVHARSEDGEIEAIRHQFLPWEGWMWHPEREDIFSARDVHRVKSLFNEPMARASPQGGYDL
jgi:gamma-glutamyl-gamma-aminobutyrate hydrolase PuuD